jgi:hypothetical protein
VSCSGFEGVAKGIGVTATTGVLVSSSEVLQKELVSRRLPFAGVVSHPVGKY